MLIRIAKPSDAPRIAYIHVASWRTTYAGILPSDVLDALSVEQRTTFWQQVLESAAATQTTFVAVDEQDIPIGFAACGVERENSETFTGEIYALYLLASHQRQGSGSQLVHACAYQLFTAGHQSMLVWVLEANPACSFYHHLGGQRITTKMITIGTASVPEVSYGWSNLCAFIQERP